MENDLKIAIKTRYFPTLPYLTPERSQKFFGIILTLAALSFFGIFAISPTISTILKLKKELSDSELVFSKLETKIKNLSALRTQYSNLQDNLTTVTNAITLQPNVALLFAQIQSITQTSDIKITKLQNSEVEILKNNKPNDKKYYSYTFSAAGTGSFENILSFVSNITNMQRIINIDVLTINNVTEKNGQPLNFDMQGTAFFKE